ncbi:MAG: DUF5060 domain-containing protein [Pirellulales bacterium]|nr:DUF5060 domain-containing protein [Pirellulales bacterium]
MRLSVMLYAVILSFLAWNADAADRGTFAKWSKIELIFTGPPSMGRGEPNPFEVRLDVHLNSPSGKIYHVPGFYDGDSTGGLNGNVWKVRFSADESGEWTFKTTSTNQLLDGKTDRFTIVGVSAKARGFWKWGRLECVGTAENRIRYLKFRDGPFWLKAGCDDPENFLGNYRNFDTPTERKAAVDFLAERGINSLYIMTNNVAGDERDVWPWLGQSAAEAISHAGKNARFDVAKLDQWQELFEYMQTKSVVPYLVLEDDSAWKGYDHVRYYREIIARFGYLPALVFNLGEEHNENYQLSEALDYMRQLEKLDPYDHPRGIHNVNLPNDMYIDAEQVDFTSIQTGSPGSRGGIQDALEHNQLAIDWIEGCVARQRRILVVNFDEARPEEYRRCWWSVYLGGGIWESHVHQPYDRPLSAWEPVWTQLGGARAFMESLPFWEMQPLNKLVQDGDAICLANPPKAYALYLPSGGSVTVKLALDATYQAAWWDPANGQEAKFQDQQIIQGGSQRLTAPGSGDWALRIINKGRQ